MPTKTLIITSAYRLSQAEVNQILTNIGITNPSKVKYENVVDQGILAGLIIKYDGYYLDLSLKNKLREIVGSLS